MMLSRVADAFFWMSRYLERAEHSARVLEVHRSLILDDPTARVGESLLVALGSPRSDDEDEEPPGPVQLDRWRQAAVRGSIVAARENARQIREQITAEMWQQLNTMYLGVRDSEHDELAEPGVFLRSVVEGAHLFHGVTDATLSHGSGWHCMELGRYVERATVTASLLEGCFEDGLVDADGAPLQRYVEWAGLLRACAAYESYCRFYTADIRPERLAEFLLLNAESPRSVRFAADRLEESLRALSRGLGRQATGRPERLAGRLRATLSFGTIDEIIADNLVRSVASIRKQCDQIHAALYQTYITYPIESAIAR